MRVLVVNAGSSSLKLRVVDGDGSVLVTRDLAAPLGAKDAAAVTDALADVAGIEAVGHRVVHGGEEFAAPVLIDDDVVRRLATFIDLAPLHQPKALLGIAAVRAAFHDTPQVACFDTAFHARISLAAATYALPREWTRRFGLRRYGFHGLSHAYAFRRVAELMRRDVTGLRLVTCHLGAGVSLAAVRDGRSVDTTMGFTPLEGLVMATRSGDVDPGMLLYLQRRLGLTADELSTELTERSGLLGLAGTADMREAIERAASGDADAALALDVYVHRLRGAVARMTAALGGLDALVFTAGVGEHAPLVRQRTADGLGFLGVAVDPARNARGPEDREISPPGSPAKVYVVTAREDLEIARETRESWAGTERAVPNRAEAAFSAGGELVQRRRGLEHVVAGREQSRAHAHRAVRERAEVPVGVRRAVQAGAHGDLVAIVEQRRQLLRREPVEVEGEQAHATLPPALTQDCVGAVEREQIATPNSFDEGHHQPALVFRDALHPPLQDDPYALAQAGQADHVGGAGLEAKGKLRRLHR